MKLNVITPSFKQLDWLKLCITSVADQCASSKQSESRSLTVEHIIQDAGTPDIEIFAQEIAMQLRSQYGGEKIPSPSATEILHFHTGSGYTLRIFKEIDDGMYDAINRGLHRSTGEVIAYLNCDEQYLPGALNKVAEWFSQNSKKDVLFCDAIVVDQEGKYICDRRAMVPTKWHTQVSGNLSFLTCSTFFRSSVIQKEAVFFDAKWKAVGDAVWALELLRHHIRMAVEPWKLAVHTDTGENLILSERSRAEQKTFFTSAPWGARYGKFIIVWLYRMRRLLAGAYFPKPHFYEIYTLKSPDQRLRFDARLPSFRWHGR